MYVHYIINNIYIHIYIYPYIYIYEYVHAIKIYFNKWSEYLNIIMTWSNNLSKNLPLGLRGGSRGRELEKYNFKKGTNLLVAK